MTNRIYCHIGLPKTATTTLQSDYFPYVEHSRYVYLGVGQPRDSRSSDDLYHLVLQAINSGEGIESAAKALKSRLLGEEKSLIISEEMLTVSVQSASWQEKMTRLKAILAELDYRILITVREPVSAMFSFYLELYSRFSASGQPFSEQAMHNNDFAIYHYDTLLAFLFPLFGKENIYLQQFEHLVRGDFSKVDEFLDYPKMESVFSGLGVNNAKRKTEKGVYVPVKLRLRWVTAIYNLVGGEKTVLGRALKTLGQYPVRVLRGIKYKNVPVPVLTEEEKLQLKSSMSSSMDLLSEQYGVKY